MKFNELSLNDVKSHLRVEDNNDDMLIDSYLQWAKKYVLSYTGLTIDEADIKEDLSFAVLALVGDFYENRLSSTTVQSKPNPIVDSILAMHSVNYL